MMQTIIHVLTLAEICFTPIAIFDAPDAFEQSGSYNICINDREGKRGVREEGAQLK
jgi:hypothetical protein